MAMYLPRVRRDLGFGPRGNSRRALIPWAPAHQQSARGVGGSARGVIDQGDFHFRHRFVGVVHI